MSAVHHPPISFFVVRKRGGKPLVSRRLVFPSRRGTQNPRMPGSVRPTTLSNLFSFSSCFLLPFKSSEENVRSTVLIFQKDVERETRTVTSVDPKSDGI